MRIIEKGRVFGEKEAFEILENIESSLRFKEQVYFFFFFVKNGVIFHFKNNESFLKSQLLKNKIDFQHVVDLDINTDFDLKIVNDKIYEIWEEYIRGNSGTCSNYFGEIARNLIKCFLEKNSKYLKLNREAKIHFSNPIHDDEIDLIAHSDTDCDLFECKHSARSQIDKSAEQLDKLCEIVVDLKSYSLTSSRFFATIELINKSIIRDLINDIGNVNEIYIHDVINGEDVFNVKIKN